MFKNVLPLPTAIEGGSLSLSPLLLFCEELCKVSKLSIDSADGNERPRTPNLEWGGEQWEHNGAAALKISLSYNKGKSAKGGGGGGGGGPFPGPRATT